PVQKGRAGRPSHFQEWKLFNSHSLAIALSSSFSKKCDRPFGICHKVRSPLIPLSQTRSIALLEFVNKCDRSF
ncbi:hypothetical protein QUB17_33855, partial [Microcoleus sp. B5-C4]|uniref:hypothetical protein n=1 Tax=Microcoleus sp. B5-C4 TaxID=2818675 RepID=UPI002FD210F3